MLLEDDRYRLLSTCRRLFEVQRLCLPGSIKKETPGCRSASISLSSKRPSASPSANLLWVNKSLSHAAVFGLHVTATSACSALWVSNSRCWSTAHEALTAAEGPAANGWLNGGRRQRSALSRHVEWVAALPLMRWAVRGAAGVELRPAAAVLRFQCPTP